MPPASKPEAARASTPASRSAAASSGVVAVPIVKIFLALHSSKYLLVESEDETEHRNLRVQQDARLIFKPDRRIRL